MSESVAVPIEIKAIRNLAAATVSGVVSRYSLPRIYTFKLHRLQFQGICKDFGYHNSACSKPVHHEVGARCTCSSWS